MCGDLYGSDKEVEIDGTLMKVSSLYFNFKKLQEINRSDSSGSFVNMSGYEKIRVVGKGMIMLVLTMLDYIIKCRSSFEI